MAPQKYTDAQITEAVESSLSLSEAARKLGTHPQTVTVRARRLGLDLGHHNRFKFSDEMIRAAASQATSYRNMMLLLGMKESGGSYVHLKNRVALLDLDITHFTGMGHGRGGNPCTPWEEILVLREPGSARCRAKTLRRALLRSGREYICETATCTVAGDWLGTTITLQVDHRNGLKWDDRPENLRFLCPNCHTQTSTWGYHAKSE